MKKWIFFLAGLGIGVSAGVLFTKRHYQELAFHEINEVRDLYRKKNASKELANRNEEAKKKLLKDISEEKPEQKDGKENYEVLINRYSGFHNVFRNPPDESKLDVESDSDSNSDDPYEVIVDHESPSDGYSEPYRITEEEFASEKMFYDKVIVEYYTNGVAVLEETDELIESIEDLIGPDILNQPIEEDEIYVRNDQRSTDYGILFTGQNFGPEEGFD